MHGEPFLLHRYRLKQRAYWQLVTLIKFLFFISCKQLHLLT
jgi:hypothetical protein